MSQAITQTDFQFPGQTHFYEGKVRDIYTIDNDYLVMVVTDRISAFDVVLPKGIPFKGQILNQIADRFLDATSDILPNWKIAIPAPMVTVGHRAAPYPVEMVIRGYLTGHAWREYKAGKRELCGVPLPEGMQENEKFSEPIITPTTKAVHGHDQDISKEEIISRGLVVRQEYEKLEEYTRALFDRGSQMADDMGLILVDTKYEFGMKDNKIMLLDEVHTPDSSRYFIQEGYEARFRAGGRQKQLSKEFVREWLMEQGFQGKEGQKVPDMPDNYIAEVSQRYIELFEQLTGEKFFRVDTLDLQERIERNVTHFLQTKLRGGKHD